MSRPPYGLCLPCSYVRSRDGDTHEVSLRGSRRLWAIRLMGIDCPELREPGGKEAKAFAEAALAGAEQVSVWVPMPADEKHLLRSLTFDRIPGDLWLDATKTLTDLLLEAGHAAVRE